MTLKNAPKRKRTMSCIYVKKKRLTGRTATEIEVPNYWMQAQTRPGSNIEGRKERGPKPKQPDKEDDQKGDKDLKRDKEGQGKLSGPRTHKENPKERRKGTTEDRKT